MCLICFAWQKKENTPFFAISNRDEFYHRPAQAAHYWEDFPMIYAGRDLEAGGTWLGISQQNNQNVRFAAITNVRVPHLLKDDAPTRGLLVRDFLASNLSPSQYIQKIRRASWSYNGFNLLVGTQEELIWFSNYGLNHPLNGKPLKPGYYGLSNALLNDPWPKVVKTKQRFQNLFEQGANDASYFELLQDNEIFADHLLPQTFVPMDWERCLSSICIDSQKYDYGTRASTIVSISNTEKSRLVEKVIR